jgi:hypothetical protein
LLDDDTASDLLQQTGYRKPVTNITLTDRPGLMSVLVDYHIMARSKAELDQFCQGLHYLVFWI